MEEELILVKPSMEYEKQAINLIEEVEKFDKDENNEIVKWYFDVAREIGQDNGIPYEDDMYLDVVVTPEGNVILLDEDEFKEAYDKKEMTKAEFDEAYKISYDLMEQLRNNKDKLQQYTDKYLNKFLNSKGGQKNEL